MPSARIQPQGRARVDPKLGVKFLVNPAFGTTDTISGLKLTSSFNTPTKGAAPQGVARVYPNASDYYDTSGALRATTAYSLLIYANVVSTQGFAGLFARTSDYGTTNSFHALQINGSELRIVANAGDYISTQLASKIVGAGPVACVVTWDSSSGRVTLWVNGQQLYAQSGVLTTTPAYNAGQGILKIFSSRDVPGVTGNMYLTAYAPDVAWSDAKARELSTNPWAVYQAQAPMLYAASAPAGTTVTAMPGTVSASGLPASVSLPTAIAAAVGALSVSGRAAAIVLPTSVSASVGTVGALGLAATVTATASSTTNVFDSQGSGTTRIYDAQLAIASGGVTVVATKGAVSDAGQSATIVTPTVIAAALSASSVAGLAATVSTGASISASTAAVTNTGLAASVTLPTVIAATLGAASVAGLPATIQTGAAISAAVGTVTATGRAATVTLPTVINVTTGTSAASGLLASIQSGAAISATTGQIVATGRTATIVAGVTINCATGAASAAGLSAFIPVATLVSCTPGTATAYGLTATIAIDRPAPLPNHHNLYRGMPRTRAYLGRARLRIYQGRP